MTALRAAWRRLPEEVRRCARPLNLADELGAFLPPRLRSSAATATEMARRLLYLRRARLPVVRLEGKVHPEGPALDVLIAGDPLSIRYFGRTFYATPPAAAEVARVGLRDVPAAAERLGRTADLSLWQVAWPVTRRAACRELVPSHVPLVLATDRPLDDIVRGERRGRSSRKDDARRVRKLGLAVRVAHEPDAWARFHRQLYEPYTRQRFGDLYRPIPPWVFRHAVRNGWLLLLEDRGRAVGGALLERWADEVRVLAFGVDLDASVPPGLALEACYYHAIGFAAARRLPRLSLGTVRPVLTDGVLRYKRKWGATLGRPTTWERFILHWRSTAGTRAALTAAPLVVQRPGGELFGLAGAAGVDVGAQAAAVDTPGLAELVVLSDEAHVPEPAPGDTPIRLVRDAA
jgi:hypothetical protein